MLIDQHTVELGLSETLINSFQIPQSQKKSWSAIHTDMFALLFRKVI